MRHRSTVCTSYKLTVVHVKRAASIDPRQPSGSQKLDVAVRCICKRVVRALSVISGTGSAR